MNISVSTTLPIKRNYQYNKNNIRQSEKIDSFDYSCKNTEKKNVSFKKGFLSKLFGTKEVDTTFQETNVSPYIKSLQKGIQTVFDEKIPAANFASIMSPEEFKEELKNLKIENFDIKNINSSDPNKVYCADLDNATTFSTGKTDVYTLLEKVAETANAYNAKTGKKFLFAITDRDTVEGVQHAVRIIASEPEKFKNLKFIPSMKMSFTHPVPSNKNYTRYENSEMLVYGINPFSPKLVDFVTNTLEKRKQMTIDFIKAVRTIYPEFDYTVKEFGTQNRIKFLKDFSVSNLYWRAREYVETKGDTKIRGITLTPEEITEATIQILNELYVIQQGSENRNISTIGSRIIDDNEEINKTIKEIFRKHATHELQQESNPDTQQTATTEESKIIDDTEVLEDTVSDETPEVSEATEEMDEPEKNSENNENKDKNQEPIVIAPAENVLKEMVEIFKNEVTRPVMAISAPFYLSDYFPDKPSERKGTTFFGVVNFLKDLQKKTDGMLIAFESKVPKYRLDDKLYERPKVEDFPNDNPKDFNPSNPNFYKLKEQSILRVFNNFIRKNKELNLFEVGGSWHDPYKDKFIDWMLKDYT